MSLGGGIDLRLGHPSASLLPSLAICNAAKSVFTEPLDGLEDDEIRHPLVYGPDQGAITIRNTIGKWSAKRYNLAKPIPGERLHITGGASIGLIHVLQQFTHSAYTRIFIVSPVYYLACASFIDAGFGDRLTAVDEGKDGCNIELLTSKIKEFEALEHSSLPLDGRDKRERKVFRFLLYCVPTYSNPSGKTMSLACRKELLRIARAHDMLIVSDDVYDFLSYTGSDLPPPPRMVTLDAQDCTSKYGNTISNCSFSKLLAPGLRTGWIESATPRLPHILGIGGANHSGGCANNWTSFAIEKMILSGELDKNIAHLQQVYGDRAKMMVETLKKLIGDDLSIQGGQGGYFLWIKLPVDARLATKRAAEQGVVVANGDMAECFGGVPPMYE
jgi:DNA-binding transcriptional MocR family regulator